MLCFFSLFVITTFLLQHMLDYYFVSPSLSISIALLLEHVTFELFVIISLTCDNMFAPAIIYNLLYAIVTFHCVVL